MSVASGVVLYVIIWWLVLFMVLPWGIHVPDETERGFARSAPEKPRLLLKAGITTAIATALWGVAYLIIISDLISFRAT